ncbi:hypothetical protein B0H15DRAFT_57700 [Mycena belliarum]|uniref:Uncharacterized protein n=1 Tax=Mycena belliarum TaxID=1033014 RepID=A0AAD6UF75_9AGAR|nr:hypothetical protein B0H15DRAFT_57700 [Mycena belliae]
MPGPSVPTSPLSRQLCRQHSDSRIVQDGSLGTRARRDSGTIGTSQACSTRRSHFLQIGVHALPIDRRRRQRCPTYAIPRLPGAHLRAAPPTPAQHARPERLPRACERGRNLAAGLSTITDPHRVLRRTSDPLRALFLRDLPLQSRVLPALASIRLDLLDLSRLLRVHCPVFDFIPNNGRLYQAIVNDFALLWAFKLEARRYLLSLQTSHPRDLYRNHRSKFDSILDPVNNERVRWLLVKPSV